MKSENTLCSPTLRLPARLAAALELLPPCDAIIDVGCDHGKLCLAVLLSQKATHVTALDVSAASLDKARALFHKYGQTADFIEADGVETLSPAIDQTHAIALCGLGGEGIAGILDRGAALARRAITLVMQPMGGERELRQWLCNNDYAVLEERVVFDAGRFYQLIAARYAPELVLPYENEALLEFGALNYAARSEALRRLLERVCASRTRRMERAKRRGVVPPALERELHGVMDLLERWEEQV